MAIVVVLIAGFLVFRSTSDRPTTPKASSVVAVEESTTTQVTTVATTTTTVPRTTTTYNGRSYCNADGIAELLGKGGFEGVPAGSYATYGLFTDDRRIKYTSDRMWALAYTHYGTAPFALPRPWPADATPIGWLNCQSGRWVYIANGLPPGPTCATMDSEFRAAYLELTGAPCQ